MKKDRYRKRLNPKLTLSLAKTKMVEILTMILIEKINKDNKGTRGLIWDSLHMKTNKINQINKIIINSMEINPIPGPKRISILMITQSKVKIII